jgi:hypothetical protein
MAGPDPTPRTSRFEAMTTTIQIEQRLAEIEADLEERQPRYEQAAGDRARLLRNWEKRLLIATKRATGANESARKAAAFVAAHDSDDGELFEQLTDAESKEAALRAAVKVLEARSTIGMSLLRAARSAP